jgi:hypothetical protein
MGWANLARRNMVLGMSPGSSYHPHPTHGDFDSPDVEQRITKCINAWILRSVTKYVTITQPRTNKY